MKPRWRAKPRKPNYIKKEWSLDNKKPVVQRALPKRRKCNVCQKIKSQSQFSIGLNGGVYIYLNNWCTDCVRKASKERYQATKDRRRKVGRSWGRIPFDKTAYYPHLLKKV